MRNLDVSAVVLLLLFFPILKKLAYLVFLYFAVLSANEEQTILLYGCKGSNIFFQLNDLICTKAERIIYGADKDESVSLRCCNEQVLSLAEMLYLFLTVKFNHLV